MKKLRNLLEGLKLISSNGDLDMDILGVSTNSKLTEEGHIFFAVKGNSIDGHKFIDAAIKKGCNCVICSILPKKIYSNVSYIQVENIRIAVNKISAKFYDNPVPSSEVQKFWEDLSENKHNFGLFVSLNSPISNQQNCIHIESRGGKIGIFVYSENQDQMRHIVAYGMMREFARLNCSGQEITSAYSEVIVNLI